MVLNRREIEHVFERLRSGVVPERGLDAFAVGIERQRNEVGRMLDLATSGEGVFKFLRGGYGCGKTFMARLAVLDAQARKFATSFVVVSENDLQLHKFDDVYRKVVGELSTSACPRGALGDIVDRWIAKVESGLIAAGADESAADFDDKVQERLGEDLVSATRGAAPDDFVRVMRAVFKAKQAGNTADAAALLSWLSGSSNVAASAKKAAGIKGDITSRDALNYLHGILEVVKAAGYTGLVIVIDEAETILRMRQDVRAKSLNGIRQICDVADRYHGLLWMFTGTPDFFDTKRGVAGLAPLHDRIQFLKHGELVSLRQAQLELKPFDKVRLKEVALKLREMYPASDRARLERALTAEYIERLVDQVSSGFRGDVGVVPRQFLRRFIDVTDLASDPEHGDFDPASELQAETPFQPRDPTEDETRKACGQPPYDPEPGDEKGYPTTSVVF